MKGIRDRYIEKHTKVCAHRRKRRLTSKRKRYLKNYLDSNGGVFIQNDYAIITCPKRICIYRKEATEKTISFINHLRSILQRHRKVTIDFSALEHCSAAGTLLLLATIDNYTRLRGTKPKINLPKSDKIKSIFKQTGLLDVLGRSLPNAKEYDDVSFWNFTTGTQVDGEKTSKIIEQLIGKVASEKRRKLFSGMQEAISNSVEHAYKNLNRSSMSQLSRWWAFGGTYKNHAVLLICDLGQGIPSTVKAELNKRWLTKALSLFNGQYTKDGDLIYAATRKGETQTDQKNRGHGLAEIKKFIEKTPGGNLAIYSNRGVFNLKAGKLTSIPSTIGNKKSICGTIIEWEIPLEEESND